MSLRHVRLWFLYCISIFKVLTQNPQTKRITDFFSFYTLPSTIIGNTKHGTLEAAYLFYYAANVAFTPNAEEDGRLQARLQELIQDALVIADQVRHNSLIFPFRIFYNIYILG